MTPSWEKGEVTAPTVLAAGAPGKGGRGVRPDTEVFAKAGMLDEGMGEVAGPSTSEAAPSMPLPLRFNDPSSLPRDRWAEGRATAPALAAKAGTLLPPAGCGLPRSAMTTSLTDEMDAGRGLLLEWPWLPLPASSSVPDASASREPPVPPRLRLPPLLTPLSLLPVQLPDILTPMSVANLLTLLAVFGGRKAACKKTTATIIAVASKAARIVPVTHKMMNVLAARALPSSEGDVGRLATTMSPCLTP